jgi:hypothetical protein
MRTMRITATGKNRTHDIVSHVSDMEIARV